MHPVHSPSRRTTAVALLSVLAGPALRAQESASPPPAAEGRPFFELHVYGNGLARHENKAVIGEDGRDVSDFARIRAIDFDLRAPIADDVGLVLVPRIASDDANTDHELDLEEAYLHYDLESTLGIDPWRLRFSVGEMRTPFGWMNSVRLFDLPQVDRPRALRVFFGEDGYVQTSFRLDLGLPLPEPHSLVLTWEHVDSGNPPLTVDEGGRVGAKVGRVAWTRDGDWRWTLGASHMSAQQADRNQLSSRLTGADLLVGRPTPGRSFYAGGEWIGADIGRDGPPDRPETYYAWGQLQVARDWYVGGRYDVSQELDAPGLETRTAGAYVTWTQTENLRYTFFAQHSRSDVDQLDDAARVFLEVDFALGRDPALPAWVHR